MHPDLFLIFLAASAAGAATGVLFPPGAWYSSLNKPTWTPGRWVFPVAWSVLYLLSSYAASRVAAQPGSGMALAFWAMQIAFNTLWTPVFFGAHRMRMSLVVMAILWLAVAAMFVTFWPLDWVAGLLVLPYLGWLTLAAALNLWIVRNNPREGTAG
ncbi:MAG: tryptophan-rich sensory protein [Paracoccaceae bacterium]|nr:tryptophan-rich sensory protein [Paracoccaceae bacterium]